jgi:hypothetical protein
MLEVKYKPIFLNFKICCSVVILIAEIIENLDCSAFANKSTVTAKNQNHPHFTKFNQISKTWPVQRLGN